MDDNIASLFEPDGILNDNQININPTNQQNQAQNINTVIDIDLFNILKSFHSLQCQWLYERCTGIGRELIFKQHFNI